MDRILRADRLLAIGLCLALSCGAASGGAGKDAVFAIPGTGQEIRFAHSSGDGMLPDAVLVQGLTDWIVAQTGWPAPAELPQIRFTSRADMAALHAGAGSASLSAPGRDGVEALYDSARGIIHLSPDWRATPVHLSALVHELAHHLQAQSGRRFGCVGLREGEAYAVQGAWLEQFGETLESSFGINRLMLFVLTTCGM